MMSCFFREHRKLCIVSGTVLSLILLALYLYALFLPGVWHENAFLYRQPDGSFRGSNSYSYYEMRITTADIGTDVTFSVNDTVREYRMIHGSDTGTVEILENEESVFRGRAVTNGDILLLINDDSGPSFDFTTVGVGDDFFTVPDESEQFPSLTQLYSWAVRQNIDTRGNTLMPILIFIFAVLLILDIAYPNLFFTLKYGLHVDGGQPSDFYLFGQKAGRVLLAAGIPVCVILSFTVR